MPIIERELDNSVLTIRFVGEQLKTKSLPIYELGTALVSVQRLIHKAYLAEFDRLDKGTFPDRNERKQLALQIAAHEKHSDYYAFLPFLNDPATAHTIHNAVLIGLKGLGKFALKKVIDAIKSKDEPHRIYINSIYAEVVNIVGPIQNNSGCTSIEIGSPKYAPKETIEFTPSSKHYLKQIANESYLGQIQTITGRVVNMDPNQTMVEIRRPGGRKCKIFMTPHDFSRVRYGQIKSPMIRVTGRPKHKIGTEGKSFDEFEANEIILMED